VTVGFHELIPSISCKTAVYCRPFSHLADTYCEGGGDMILQNVGSISIVDYTMHYHIPEILTA